MTTQIEVIDSLKESIQEYEHTIGKQVAVDFLIEIQDKISCYSFTLSNCISESRTKYINSKIIYEAEVQASEFKYNQDGLPAMKAKNAAKYDNEDRFKQMIILENKYKNAKRVLDQVNHIIRSLMQKISYLKIEKNTN